MTKFETRAAMARHFNEGGAVFAEEAPDAELAGLISENIKLLGIDPIESWAAYDKLEALLNEALEGAA